MAAADETLWELGTEVGGNPLFFSVLLHQHRDFLALNCPFFSFFLNNLLITGTSKGTRIVWSDITTKYHYFQNVGLILLLGLNKSLVTFLQSWERYRCDSVRRAQNSAYARMIPYPPQTYSWCLCVPTVEPANQGKTSLLNPVWFFTAITNVSRAKMFSCFLAAYQPHYSAFPLGSQRCK